MRTKVLTIALMVIAILVVAYNIANARKMNVEVPDKVASLQVGERMCFLFDPVDEQSHVCCVVIRTGKSEWQAKVGAVVLYPGKGIVFGQMMETKTFSTTDDVVEFMCKTFKVEIGEGV